ncbi:hypothetical protein TcasGA2_TC002021 [Tribolium castaneum]|uniref:Uncharacterized protein n=1 Tax=Tribolium castaneum TaxID=7070 RepID=D7EKG6_TRICA|nr:hypothetical protein TcasGA2_TC002021 [Tribolium castaneum]
MCSNYFAHFKPCSHGDECSQCPGLSTRTTVSNQSSKLLFKVLKGKVANPYQNRSGFNRDKPRINIVSDVIIRPANSKLIKNDEIQFEQFVKSSLSQYLREDCLEENVIKCSQLSVKEKQLANHAVANIVQIVDEDDDSMVTPSSQPDSELWFSLPFTQYLAQHGIENDYSDDISLTLIDQLINEDEAASNPVVDEGTCPINNSVPMS